MGTYRSLVNEKQSAEEAAGDFLKMFTGLDKPFMEQLHAFTDIGRETTQRTISLTYFSLINMQAYKEQTGNNIFTKWFSIQKLPELIAEHIKILDLAKERIKYKAAKQPLLFELLPSKFTILQLHTLYEKVFNIQFDRRNIDRKLKQTNILVKLSEKDKTSSRKGAFYYKLSHKKIKNFTDFGNIVPLKYHLS
jgi:8-oxo-dGTP diphosphatase